MNSKEDFTNKFEMLYGFFVEDFPEDEEAIKQIIRDAWNVGHGEGYKSGFEEVEAMRKLIDEMQAEWRLTLMNAGVDPELAIEEVAARMERYNYG